MIAVNDCVCMDFSLLFSLFPHVNTIHTYNIKRVNETEQERERERRRERKKKTSTPINEETHRSDYTSIH